MKFWVQCWRIYRAESAALDRDEEALAAIIPRRSFWQWMKLRGQFGPWPPPWMVANLPE